MSYAGQVRPVLDRVYVGVRVASRDRMRAAYDRLGLQPGFESSFYFGLLARPMTAEAFAAATTYSGGDMAGELAQGTAEVDAGGGWRLTSPGRQAALAVQQALAEGAGELWSRTTVPTMPGLAMVPRLAELVGRLLQAGLATGGPVFHAMAPVSEPDGASAALRLVTRLGALRHHRADAHRAAWAAAGLTVQEIQELPDGPQRQAIEVDTNRRDEPIYAALTAEERVELLAGLGALPG